MWVKKLIFLQILHRSLHVYRLAEVRAILTMCVLSESAWGDPSDSPCSATYRTLGLSLEAMTSVRSSWREDCWG